MLFRSPPSEKTLGEILYEHVPVTDPSAIRIVIAAYLRRSLPEGLYIDIKPERETLEKMVPSGASVNPQIPLLPDSEVFATHRCHSDFDYHSLTQYRERALQFFRWKAWVKESCLSTTSVPGAVLKGVTNGLSLADDPLSWKFGTTSTLLVLSTWSFWMN